MGLRSQGFLKNSGKVQAQSSSGLDLYSRPAPSHLRMMPKPDPLSTRYPPSYQPHHGRQHHLATARFRSRSSSPDRGRHGGEVIAGRVGAGVHVGVGAALGADWSTGLDDRLIPGSPIDRHSSYGAHQHVYHPTERYDQHQQTMPATNGRGRGRGRGLGLPPAPTPAPGQGSREECM
ncbi:unnamed protein product [Vitrella brassicaformis CCMP3155]|uniref:Uncharacterized protein n=1 Tax=Vitrella brassicaformis (strain CCMP3155) TaxID=1169540 RepID=A0A0G4EHJ7_VITBC|nr:unnamed protein product [Vitrella brassicaformis CCMP3155]|eukprot:CEL95967.1 unnamed protein product [Vitrella brassicaformis CCMP3155]